MQQVETGKKTVNELVSNYGPVGPRHLLAAAMLMRPQEKTETEEHKAEKVRLAEKAAA